MMRAYICQQCRLQLPRRAAAPRFSQLQSRAIVSFRKSPATSQPTTEAQQSPEPTHGEADSIPDGYTQEPPTAINGRYSGGAGTAGAAGRYSRTSEPPSTGRLEQPWQRQQREITPMSGIASATSVAQPIQRLLGQDAKAAWDLFEKTFASRDVPALIDPPLSDVPLLAGGKLFTQLSQKINQEWTLGNDHVPTPTQVLFRYEQLDVAPERIWNQTMASLTFQLLRSMAPSQERAAHPSGPASQRDTEAILAELLSLWRLFFQRYGAQQQRDPLTSISPDWNTLPEEEITFDTGKSFGHRLQQFHPTYATAPELQYSAITIFNYFYGETQSPRTISESLRQQNQRFLRQLTSTLSGANIVTAFRHAEMNEQIRSLDKDYLRSIAAQMDMAPGLARKVNGLDSSATPEEKASHLQESILRRVGRYVMMQANTRELEKLWTDVEVLYKTSDGKSAIPRPIYNAFLSGFMTLFQPDHTVRVWNHMISSGVNPDLETWNAMLLGCAKGKDLPGLNAVWDRMLRTGTEPDQHCWTTRVHATVILGKVEAAMAVLDEMSSRWLAGEKAAKQAKGINKATKPEIGVINGAVDGITRVPTKGDRFRRHLALDFKTKISYIQKVLQWAGSFGIRPDTRTYNALIKLYLKGNDFPTAFKLLRQMEMEGLEGDLATHTMLLRAAFDNQKFDSLSHQEQTDRMLDLFQQLEQGGLKPNTYVYQIAVDRLLQHYSNYQGVRTIIEHMMSKGFGVSPQIYTSLVTHYFQQDPPAIREIDTLVTRILGPPAAPTDRFLFDRIIEGYAKVGEIESMMKVLNKMEAHGKRPSFIALREVVMALYNVGRRDTARAIVRDVELGQGIANAGVSKNRLVDRRKFFYDLNHLAPELLVPLAGEHLTSPIQAQSNDDAQPSQEGEQMLDPVQQDEQTPYNNRRPRYEHVPYEHMPYETQPRDQQPYDQQPYDQQPYDQQPYDQQPYDQQPYDQQPYDQQPYDQQPYDQDQAQDDQMSYPPQPPNRQTQHIDDDIYAEHASYLSDEPEAPQPQPQPQPHWKSGPTAGRR